MDFETYGLKIFSQVMMDGSFSAAARSLKITQPTVSQQIAKLEHQLGGKLFERVGHYITATPLAKEFMKYVTTLLELTTEFSEKLQNQRTLPKGSVRYAMPESCQWTPHYRKIMSQIVQFPEVFFKIEILPNEMIVKSLLEGKIDFGFIVGERISPELRFQKFSDEVYSVVAKDKKMFQPLSDLDNISSLRLITYPGWEPFFSCWAKANGIWKSLKSKLKEPTVHIGSLAGAIHATQEGAGVGIIPTHCVSKELEEGSLFEWRSNKAAIAMRPVSIARKAGDKMPKRVELVLEMLRQAKKEI